MDFFDDHVLTVVYRQSQYFLMLLTALEMGSSIKAGYAGQLAICEGLRKLPVKAITRHSLSPIGNSRLFKSKTDSFITCI